MNWSSFSEEAKIPVKIRACDTMGYGVPYSEVALPRSVPGIIYGLQHYSDLPSEMLEWHGHNDFYKAVTNAATAWLYGACAGQLLACWASASAPATSRWRPWSLNTPPSAARSTAWIPTVITEIADYFQKRHRLRDPRL